MEKQDDVNNPRGNIYAGVRVGSKYFNLSSTVFYQPNVEDIEHYRVNLNLGVETQLGKTLFQQISYSMVKDTRPPTKIAKTDGTFLVEVGARY